MAWSSRKAPLRNGLSCFALSTLQSVLWILFIVIDFLALVIHWLFLRWYIWLWFRVRRLASGSTEGRSGQGFEDEETLVTGRTSKHGRKTVVIVGGSFAGLASLRHLSFHAPDCKIILVDQREYFEYTPGVLRLFCAPELFSTMARASPKGSHEFLLGVVSSVNSDHVIVAKSGGQTQRLEFDYLILATGADYSRPVTPSVVESTLGSRSATWHAEAARVQAANSVLILGGGAVGVELAAEIVCHFPGKRVCIVDALPALLQLFPQKTSQYAQRWFQERGVELVLGEMLDTWDDVSCTTKSGRVIRADLLYVCFGSRCNSQCVSSGDLAGSLGTRKEVKVNNHLQLDSLPNVFAVGDVMSHPAGEIKQAYYAEMNGTVAAMNVINHMRGQKLLNYPEALSGSSLSPLVYVVSLGRYDGSLGFNSMVINGLLAALIKWILEWTKVNQMEGRLLGQLVWAIGDELTFLLSRSLLKPACKRCD